MENQAEMLYQAPQSVLDEASEAAGIENFKRFSAWGVFGLAVITFGIYCVYWLYSRSNKLNEFHPNKMSVALLSAYLWAYVIYLVASFSSGFLGGNPVVMMTISALGLLNLVLYLVVLFKLRNRLAEVMGTKLGPIMTFFFNTIYLQYKINEAIDARQSA